MKSKSSNLTKNVAQNRPHKKHFIINQSGMNISSSWTNAHRTKTLIKLKALLVVSSLRFSPNKNLLSVKANRWAPNRKMQLTANYSNWKTMRSAWIQLHQMIREFKISLSLLKVKNKLGTHLSNLMKASELAFWRVTKEVSVRDHQAVKIQKLGCHQAKKDESFLKAWIVRQLQIILNKGSLWAKLKNKKGWTLGNVNLDTLN